jgi:hypothetical protein
MKRLIILKLLAALAIAAALAVEEVSSETFVAGYIEGCTDKQIQSAAHDAFCKERAKVVKEAFHVE